MIDMEIPKPMEAFLTPARYKVVRGGRGSGKSWTIARLLATLAYQNPVRILCAREVQTSIRQSVHRLLQDQIRLLGYENQFEILDQEIRGKNGSLFTFTGLSSLTIDALKSNEGCDICWVEEGHTITENSWRILLPTIRKSGSEIWISYNPQLESDETHQRFTINKPADCINVEMNWRDNPWFNDVLEAERQECIRVDAESYDNIWEGKCQAAVSGAIYFKQMQESEESGRICNIPYDPTLKVHIVMDLGWEDSLSVILAQKHLSEIRIIEYIDVKHTPADALSAELRQKPYNWGRLWLPHDGFSKSLNSAGASTEDHFLSFGWDVVPKHEVMMIGREEGIRKTRMIFPQIYFNKETCAAKKNTKKSNNVNYTELNNRLIECLKRYRRNINTKTDTATTPVHDGYSHGADCLRYLAVNSENMTNEIDVKIKIPGVGCVPSNWMAT